MFVFDQEYKVKGKKLSASTSGNHVTVRTSRGKYTVDFDKDNVIIGYAKNGRNIPRTKINWEEYYEYLTWDRSEFEYIK